MWGYFTNLYVELFDLEDFLKNLPSEMILQVGALGGWEFMVNSMVETRISAIT